MYTFVKWSDFFVNVVIKCLILTLQLHRFPSMLHIEKIEAREAGIYRCRVDFKTAPTRNSLLNLSVISKSTFCFCFRGDVSCSGSLPFSAYTCIFSCATYFWNTYLGWVQDSARNKINTIAENAICNFSVSWNLAIFSELSFKIFNYS